MKSNSLPNITSIRFFLALLVVIFHISQFSIGRGFPVYNDFPVFNKGLEAVCMFFSLSGFLIIRNLFEEKLETGTISLISFYKRRILRIFPLYYSVLIFGFFYYNFLLPRLGFEIEQRQYSLWKGILLGGTFFSNILSTFQPGGILEILWSIGIEEQFYLFVAPVILLLPTKRVFIFLLIFSVAYFILYNASGLDFFSKYRMLFYYFSVSGLVGIISVKFQKIKISVIFKAIIFIIFIFYFVSNFFVNNLSEVAYQVFSVILFSMFILCAIQKPCKVLENKKLRYLGKISYGMYMLHTIVMQITGFVFLKLSTEKPVLFFVSFNLVTIILTIIASHLSYKYFESFFLKYKPVKLK